MKRLVPPWLYFAAIVVCVWAFITGRLGPVIAQLSDVLHNVKR